MKVFNAAGARGKPEAIPGKIPSDVQFIQGALKAAKNSSSQIRELVLKDLCSVLGCRLGDLEFLFSDSGVQGDEVGIYDFPDASRRRKIITDNHLIAAE